MDLRSKKRIAFSILLFVLLLAVHVFQIVFANGIKIFGIKPFVLIPAVIAVSMYAPLTHSLMFSLVLGLSCDAVSGGLFGRYGLCMMVIAGIISYLCDYVMNKNLLSALMYHLSIYALIVFLRLFWRLLILASAKGMAGMVLDILIECVYSALFLVPLYFCCKWLKGKLIQDE